MSKATQKMAVHFSSKTDMWSTPQAFFDEMSAKYGPFDLDVCASTDNAKCRVYLTEAENGLTVKWHLGGHTAYGTFLRKPKCWMNPPYGRQIGAWIKKAYEESLNGCLVCCLLPARTDTRWFHDFIYPHVGHSVRLEFIKGRLKFGDSKNAAPFPSMIVVFNPAGCHK